MESLWNIDAHNTNTNMELQPKDQMEVAEGLASLLSSSHCFSLPDYQPGNSLEQSRAEPRSGEKRKYDQNLNSDEIDQSKVMVVTAESDPLSFISSPSATSSYPSLQNYSGPFNFSASVTQLSESTKNKHWAYSQKLEKLYVDLDHWIQLEFLAPPGFYIRALPVFTQPTDIRKPVKRCPSHASLTDRTNQNFRYPEHLIRVAGEDTSYQEDLTTGRLSVVFPVLAPAPGSDFTTRQIKFMCLSSDMGGICRRPVNMVLTLEDGAGVVFGRKVFDLRLCSCPKRDKNQDEERREKQEERASYRQRSDSSIVVRTTPVGKKPLKVKDTKYLMIPVKIEDYESVDSLVQQLAESREIQNNPERPHSQVVEAVKEERINLQIEHNPGIVNILMERKRKMNRK